MVSPKSVEFRRGREKSWRRLESLVQRVERSGIRSLSEQELVVLPRLHRSAISALSVARAISLDRNLLEYLESLTARSYFCVYGVRSEFVRTVADFFKWRFPQAVWHARYHVLTSASTLLLGVAIAFALTLDDPDRYYGFISEAMAQGRDPSATTEELRSILYDETGTAADALASFATFLFQHNTQVGILCFALGFAIGIPVFYLLLTNGLLLGAMAALYHARGLSIDFWGWILPHGVTELLAIVLCGGAGLMQGQAVLFPARRSRLANLAHVGKRAGVVAIGCVLLFLVAALLEGFFRQLVHSVPVRYATATSTAVLWGWYFGWVGRRAR